jgi:hypothetical protein
MDKRKKYKKTNNYLQHYDEKQLALECKRLETEIKGTLERRRKVDESLNAKKDLHTETVEQNKFVCSASVVFQHL